MAPPSASQPDVLEAPRATTTSIPAQTPRAIRIGRSSVSSQAPIAATMPSVAIGLSVLGSPNRPIHSSSSASRAESATIDTTNDPSDSTCKPMNNDHTCWRNVNP